MEKTKSKKQNYKISKRSKKYPLIKLIEGKKQDSPKKIRNKPNQKEDNIN